MGFKGHRRRLKNFAQRAIGFNKSVTEGKGFREMLWQPSIKIGVGDHRRLITGKADLFLTNNVLEMFERMFEKEGPPKSFILVKPASYGGYSGEGVQEYFDKPTVQELFDFFKFARRAPKDKHLISKEKYFKCKRFMNNKKNGVLTQSALIKAEQELYELGRNLERYGRKTAIAGRNIIVLGVRGGKVRFAVIDLE